MFIISTTIEKLNADVQRLVDSGKIDIPTLSDLADQAEKTAEATNDLLHSLEFALPHQQDPDMENYRELQKLAMEVLQYNHQAVDEMNALKRAIRKALKQREQLQLAV